MKAGEPQDLTATTQSDAGEEQSLSLMAGVAQPEGLPEALEPGMEPARGSLRPSQTSLLILVAVILASGSLYAMRLTQRDMSSLTPKSVEAKIEQALAKLTQPKAMEAGDMLSKDNMNALFRNTDNIVSLLSVDPAKNQVPLEYVQKNPFTLPFDPTPQVAISSAGSTAAPNATYAADSAGRKLDQELQELKLKSVMPKGRVPVAIINDQLAQVGDRVGSFVVKSISGLSVELQANGQSYTITMEEGRPRELSKALPRK